MKNIIFHVLISLYIFNINAQITITNATFPKVGDTLKTTVDEGIKQQEI